MRWSKLLLGILSLIGCAPSPAGVEAVLEGSAHPELADGDRRALAMLVQSLDIEAAELGFESRDPNSLVIADGRIRELRIQSARLDDPTPIRALDGLQTLILRTGVSDTRSLGELGDLRRLSLDLDGGGLSLADALFPNLESLRIEQAEIDDLSGLAALPLESLALDDIRGLDTLASLPGLPGLEELMLAEIELESLDGLDELPALRRLRLHRVAVNDLHGIADLPRLEVLEIFGRITSLEGLPSLPLLEKIELERLELEELRVADQPSLVSIEAEDLGISRLRLRDLPRLRSLELAGNPLSTLEGCDPLPALETLDLRRTHVAVLTQLESGFDSLDRILAEDSRIAELPPGLEQRGVRLDIPAGQLEANSWTASLENGFREIEHRFVDELPRESGTAERHDARFTWSAGTPKRSTLEGSGQIGRLEGLKRLDLVEIDPANPNQGGSGPPRVKARFETSRGRVRLFLAYRHDPSGLGAALAGTNPSASDREVREGWIWAEASPGHPAEVDGMLSYFGTSVVLWIQALDGPAEGIRYELESN